MQYVLDLQKRSRVLTVRLMSEAQETEQYYREREVIRQAMSLLGKRTSERKKASSRANAKRPRKANKQTDSNTDAKSVDSDFSR